MKQFRATVIGDRYPVVVEVNTNAWHTAAHKAAEAYEQRFKGSHSNTLTIKIVRSK